MESTDPINSPHLTDYEKRALRRQRTDAEILANQRRLRPDGMKRCTKCREVRPLNKFGNDRGRPDGKRGQCRVCGDARLKARRNRA